MPPTGTPSPSRTIRPAAIPAPSGTPYERATIAPVSSTHPTPSAIPSAAVRSSVRGGQIAKGVGLPQVQQEQQRQPERGHRDQRRGHPQRRERHQRRAPRGSAPPGTACGTGAAAAGTANWPTTAAAGAHPARRRKREFATRTAHFRAARVRKSPQSPQNSPAGTSVWQTRHSIVAGASWSGRCSCRHLLQNEDVADEVVDVGRAEAGHQVVAGRRRRRPRCRRGSRRGSRAAVSPRRPCTASGLRSPSSRPPLATRYWFITAAMPAQIGAACEVPPPTNCLPSNTILTPVNGSATAATSGVSLRSWSSIRQHRALPRRAGRTTTTPRRRCPATAARRTRPARTATRPAHRWTGWCRPRRSSRAARRPSPARCRRHSAATTSLGRLCIPGPRGRRWR